jgi:hypothetical protein
MLATIQSRIFCLARLLSTNIRRTYKTVILPVVLYGCETWSLTLREEHRLRVFEIKLVRRIFGFGPQSRGRACSTNGGEEEYI